MFLYQTNSCDWLLRSQLLTSIISASGGFRRTHDGRAGALRWLISFFLVVFGETVEKKMSNLV